MNYELGRMWKEAAGIVINYIIFMQELRKPR
jgi:hypothetical protein